MKTEQKLGKLNRYTTLPFLLDLLRRRKIVLLDPSTWEDKNDVEAIDEYKRKKHLKLFAVCFCAGDETIHHWRTYAEGVWGCCIEFDKDRLLASFSGKKGSRFQDVTYKKVIDLENELKNNEIILEDFPFIKRYPYRFENEFRIIWEGNTSQDSIEVGINLNSITKITISQKMPQSMRPTIEELLCSQVKKPPRINFSTLYRNRRWIKAFKKYSSLIVF